MLFARFAGLLNSTYLIILRPIKLKNNLLPQNDKKKKGPSWLGLLYSWSSQEVLSMFDFQRDIILPFRFNWA